VRALLAPFYRISNGAKQPKAGIQKGSQPLLSFIE